MINTLTEELSSRFDTSSSDALGSVYFTKKLGEGKKLMLVTGMDTSGLVATFAEGTKINISSIGSFHIVNMAFSKVKFEHAEGVLVPLGNYDMGTPITDYAVETNRENISENITLGETAYFNEEISADEESGMICGFGSAVKTCVYFLVMTANKLLENNGEELKKLGIGEFTAAFCCQESLGSRGASPLSCAVNADEIISIAPIDMTERNVGSLTFADGVAVKMLDKSFVATESTALLTESLLDTLGVKHKRRVSNNARSSLSRLDLCDKGAGLCEIGIPFKFAGTKGETVKNPFKN